MNPRVLLRHPGTATASLPAQTRQLLRSSVSQTLVHRLLHSPGGATNPPPPSVQFQNSFLFAGGGATSRRVFPEGSKKGGGKNTDGKPKPPEEPVVLEEKKPATTTPHTALNKPPPNNPPPIGTLLPTPSRELKLLLPFSAPPLVLLVHPEQPLSALERLLRCELPQAGYIAFKTRDVAAGIVRWSATTQIGAFVAGVREFTVAVEGVGEVVISAPGFEERSCHVRGKLREVTRRVAGMEGVKGGCDVAAREAERRWGYVCWMGVVGWAGVCWLGVLGTVACLLGLVAVVGGVWVGRGETAVEVRRVRMYESRGFDLERWERLVGTAKALRGEILAMAEQYGESWDEGRDVVGGDRVRRLLREGEEKEVHA